mmetsp:Transcript_3243/g.5042  ORF Transcript_3243/g.5042 Transcript_3243/m.5042 type:complete len:417 (-) Transcript_3243:5-1255(-)
MSEFRLKDRYKQRSHKYSQETKRNEYLKRQKSLRRDLANQRRLIEDTPTREDTSNRRNRKDKYIKESQLCVPEWMVEIPSDLGSYHANRCNWYVVARPEGKRCVVVSSRGRTISYLENGCMLHSFKSPLPGGGMTGRHGSSAILECIYTPADNTYYALDIMNWNDMDCYDCEAEFRFFWLHTKFEETAGLSGGGAVAHSFRAVPHWECSLTGLEQAYRSPLPYPRNGLLFYHREGQYEIGLTPLVLLWKDATITTYLDADGEETIALKALQLSTEPHQLALHTFEGIPLVPLPSQLQTAPVVCGDVVRGAVASVGYTDSGVPHVTGFQMHKVLSGKRVEGDSWSKILFKHQLRTSPITIDHIASVVANPVVHSVENVGGDCDVQPNSICNGAMPLHQSHESVYNVAEDDIMDVNDK